MLVFDSPTSGQSLVFDNHSLFASSQFIPPYIPKGGDDDDIDHGGPRVIYLPDLLDAQLHEEDEIFALIAAHILTH